MPPPSSVLNDAHSVRLMPETLRHTAAQSLKAPPIVVALKAMAEQLATAPVS